MPASIQTYISNLGNHAKTHILLANIPTTVSQRGCKFVARLSAGSTVVRGEDGAPESAQAKLLRGLVYQQSSLLKISSNKRTEQQNIILSEIGQYIKPIVL